METGSDRKMEDSIFLVLPAALLSRSVAMIDEEMNDVGVLMW